MCSFVLSLFLVPSCLVSCSFIFCFLSLCLVFLLSCVFVTFCLVLLLTCVVFFFVFPLLVSLFSLFSFSLPSPSPSLPLLLFILNLVFFLVVLARVSFRHFFVLSCSRLVLVVLLASLVACLSYCWCCLSFLFYLHRAAATNVLTWRECRALSLRLIPPCRHVPVLSVRQPGEHCERISARVHRSAHAAWH